MKLKLTHDFFFGGKAIFTVKNNTTGEHRTYQIKITKPNARFRRPTTLMLQMTGTDNEKHYSYVGKIIRTYVSAAQAYDRKEHKPGTLEKTDNSKFSEDSKQFKACKWILRHIWFNLDWPDTMEVNHAGRCGRCGRLLTNPESIERGIGPECWGIMHPKYAGD